MRIDAPLYQFLNASCDLNATQRQCERSMKFLPKQRNSFASVAGSPTDSSGKLLYLTQQLNGSISCVQD